MASTFSRDQLDAILAYIQLPEKYQLKNNPSRDLAFLTALHTHMLSTIPYENLTIHYSKSHTISIDPQHVYNKVIVDKRGRGGYCMENSLFYTQLLLGLGFRCFPVGVRIRHRIDGIPQGEYIGWFDSLFCECVQMLTLNRVHIVNIVTLEDGTRWANDVGFGGDGATKPLPLVEGVITRNMGTQDIRLIQDFIPEQTERTPDRKMWIYQYRNSPLQDWNSFYAFSEHIEFLPADFHIMNWYTGSHPESFQTFTTLAIKFLRRPSEGNPGEQEIYGKRMLAGPVIKENLGGKTAIVQVCKTEADRIEALSRWFGIEFTEEERNGIKGYVSELK